jgi:hypothetical protein
MSEDKQANNEINIRFVEFQGTTYLRKEDVMNHLAAVSSKCEDLKQMSFLLDIMLDVCNVNKDIKTL